MAQKEPIIGIDLGTTFSCAAIVEDNGQVKLIPYKGGEFTIPSIYAVDDKGNELVGHEAKRQWQLNPKKTVSGAKRLMGLEFSSEFTAKMHKYFAYDMEPSEENAVVIPVAGRRLTVQQISAKILQKIRDVAQEYLKQPVKKAVVTVPAYFNDRQRQAVKEAASYIGLEVLRIINEPTAAALAYGLGRALNETVIVYDLGGGTFDVSIIEIRNHTFEVKATGGDIFLGGIDFDNAIIDYVIGDFHAKNGIDLHSDPVAMQRIRDMAERTKIDLSARQEAPFNIPFITITPDGNPLDINVTLTRTLMEELTGHLVESTLVTADQVLQDANLDRDAVDQVLLVGGQTRMPLIQRRVEDFFGKPPSKSVHPDEAVAIGAAIFAHSLQEGSNVEVQLLDVLPMNIGIEAANGSLFPIFKRNESIPNAKKQSFTTSFDSQDHLIMRIYQGDQKAAKSNVLLGEFKFDGVRRAPAGKAKIEVVFDVSQEGILSMSASDPDSGKEMRTTVKLKATG